MNAALLPRGSACPAVPPIGRAGINPERAGACAQTSLLGLGRAVGRIAARLFSAESPVIAGKTIERGHSRNGPARVSPLFGGVTIDVRRATVASRLARIQGWPVAHYRLSHLLSAAAGVNPRPAKAGNKHVGDDGPGRKVEMSLPAYFCAAFSVLGYLLLGLKPELRVRPALNP